MKMKNVYLAGVLVLVLLILLVSNSTFVIVQPGERGVIFRPFTGGLDKENIFMPGFNVIAPWNEVFIYNVKEQNVEETMDVLDKDALNITVDVSVRFYPKYDKIGFLHEKFGVDYVKTLVIPETRSAVRQIMGKYTAEEIFSTKRKEVEDEIIKSTHLVLDRNNMTMTALLIRSIVLPEKLQKAIESKLTQQQEFLAYRFRLEKETSEAERKRIQAEGEAKANQIINSSLTPSLLKMRGIEATILLSQSANSKVVVIGGSDGLPLILGDK
ncbi:MAG: hypothetical protein RIS47_892 [Bacteroidota bacterium]